MFKIERGSKYRKKYRKSERWTVLENIQSAFFKIEKTQNSSSFVVKKTILHFTSCCEWGK